MSCQGLLRERTGGLHIVSPLIHLVLHCNVWTLGAPPLKHEGASGGSGGASLMHILPKKFPTEIPTVPPPGAFLCPPANKVGKSGLSILTLVSKCDIMNYKLMVHIYEEPNYGVPDFIVPPSTTLLFLWQSLVVNPSLPFLSLSDLRST